MSTPVVSVLICNYNHGRFLGKCLAGVLRQTFTHFEVLITDDGSTDGSRRIIAEHAARDARIKPNYFKTNQGAMAAVADIMPRVQGKLLFCSGADDFIFDQFFFERAVAALEAHPQAAGFYGLAALYSNERNAPIDTIGKAPQEGFISPLEFYRGFLRSDIFVPGSSSIFRYDRIQAAGGFDYALGGQIDFLLNHQLPSQSGIVFARTPFTCQRVYEQQSTLGSKGSLWDLAANLTLVEKRLRAAAPAYPEMEADWKLWRAHWMVDAIRKTGVNAEIRFPAPASVRPSSRPAAVAAL